MQDASRYESLLAKVDQKAAEFRERYGQALKCQRGCSSCCISGLSVSAVEKNAIKVWLEQRPQLTQSLLSQSVQEAAPGCAFLDRQGACQIYEARPIICRTQGFPLHIAEDEQSLRDICPLNREEIDLDALPQDGLLNLNLLNTLLALIDQHEGGAGAGTRFPLTPAGILKGLA